MPRITTADIRAACQSKELRAVIPTISQLPADEVFALWQKLPNLSQLSKEKIFCAALALFIEHAQQTKELT